MALAGLGLLRWPARFSCPVRGDGGVAAWFVGHFVTLEILPVWGSNFRTKFGPEKNAPLPPAQVYVRSAVLRQSVAYPLA